MSAAGHVVFVLGPTASGKSALALDLARTFGGSILNCDSVQACARLDVGSAKPSAAERALVPHHLFDVVAPGVKLTAGEYRALALAALARAIPTGPVFVVGGSGFYVQALEKGMFDVAPPAPDVEARVRARWASAAPGEAYAELARRDPESARGLNPNDLYRVLRALIVIEDSGRTLAEVRATFRATPLPYPTLKLGLNPAPEVLKDRIARRTVQMIACGILDETRALREEGFGGWSALGAVGYRECAMVLDGELPADELPALITLRTVQLAKRQRTWFRRDAEIHWLEPDAAVDQGRALVAGFLDPSGTRG